MTVGMLRGGVAPDRVLPTAADAARELTTVEAADLGIVAGAPRITIRYTAADAELALQLGSHVASATDAVAEVLQWKVTERVKGRWYVVRAAP
jgi:hypothetical protein